MEDYRAIDALKSLAAFPQNLAKIVAKEKGGLVAVGSNGIWVCPGNKHVLHVCRGGLTGELPLCFLLYWARGIRANRGLSGIAIVFHMLVCVCVCVCVCLCVCAIGSPRGWVMQETFFLDAMLFVIQWFCICELCSDLPRLEQLDSAPRLQVTGSTRWCRVGSLRRRSGTASAPELSPTTTVSAFVFTLESNGVN